MQAPLSPVNSSDGKSVMSASSEDLDGSETEEICEEAVVESNLNQELNKLFQEKNIPEVLVTEAPSIPPP